MYLVCKMTRFYRVSFVEQKQMRISVWVNYLLQIPILLREEIAIQTSVIEPVVYATLIAPQEKRRRGISAIQKLIQFLKGGSTRLSKTSKPKWKGRLSEVASRRLDAQVKSLVRVSGKLAGNIVVRRDLTQTEKEE